MAEQGQKRILGSRLVPDLKAEQKKQKGTRYWFGLLPSCPVDPLHIGRATFAKIMEIVQTGPGGETIRNPMIGCCAALTRDEVNTIIETLPRMVIRFRTRRLADEQIDEDGNVQAADEIRVGHMIRIPSEDEIEFRKANGSYRPYIPTPDDEPAAAHMFMIKQDVRGTEYPAPLSETGLELPGE